MNRTLTMPVRVFAAAAAALLLAACDRPEERGAGQQVDETVASAQRQVDGVKDGVKDDMAAARDHASEAVAAAAGQLTDAAITASVSTALARDPGLSALRIEVDTRNGTVSLYGNAPDRAARDHATELARAIDGVVAVDNRLVVRG